MLVKRILSSLFKAARDLREDMQHLNGSILQDEGVVVFLGQEEEPVGNSYQFWIGLYNEGEFQEWPAYTDNQDLFEVFYNMQYGQVFRVTKEGELLSPDPYAEHIDDIDRDLSKYPVLPSTLIERRKFEFIW